MVLGSIRAAVLVPATQDGAHAEHEPLSRQRASLPSLMGSGSLGFCGAFAPSVSIAVTRGGR